MFDRSYQNNLFSTKVSSRYIAVQQQRKRSEHRLEGTANRSDQFSVKACQLNKNGQVTQAPPPQPCLWIHTPARKSPGYFFALHILLQRTEHIAPAAQQRPSCTTSRVPRPNRM
jgi:hypothetical protein